MTVYATAMHETQEKAEDAVMELGALAAENWDANHPNQERPMFGSMIAPNHHRDIVEGFARAFGVAFWELYDHAFQAV